jgi:tetratricopeptide (TPR) repeat protein
MKTKFTLLFTLLIIVASAKATVDTFISNLDSSGFYLLKAQESKLARKVWDAEKYFQKAIAFNPDNETVRLEFANYYIEQRKYALAGIQYKTILQKNPVHSLAISKYIEIAFLQRKWVDVISYGESAIAHNIKVDKVNFMIAKSYYEDENYGKARKYLITQFEQTPAHKETITLLGRVYVEMSMYNDAISMYQKALKASPNDFEIIYEIGLLYNAQHNEREAVQYFELAAEKGMKQDLAFLENLGMSYLSFDIKKGVEVLNKVLEKKPGDVEILTQIAQAYFKVENFAVSYDLYYKIFENDNKNIKALYMAGVSMIKKGDKTRGAQICDKAIAMDPKLGDLRSQKSVL